MTFDEYYKIEYEDKKRQSSLKEDHRKTWEAAVYNHLHNQGTESFLPTEKITTEIPIAALR